jgi:hypothetical protein
MTSDGGRRAPTAMRKEPNVSRLRRALDRVVLPAAVLSLALTSLYFVGVLPRAVAAVVAFAVLGGALILKLAPGSDRDRGD